jgi:hypothetical protein
MVWWISDQLVVLPAVNKIPAKANRPVNLNTDYDVPTMKGYERNRRFIAIIGGRDSFSECVSIERTEFPSIEKRLPTPFWLTRGELRCGRANHDRPL